MEDIKEYVYRSFLGSYAEKRSVDEALITFAALSVFLPFFFSAAVVAAGCFFVLMSKRRRAAVSDVRGARSLYYFFALVLITAVYYKNTLGFLAGLVIISFLYFGLYIRAFMSRPLFERIADMACAMSIFCAALAVVQRVCFKGDLLDGRACSTFTNANYYATVAVFVILISVYKLVTGNINRAFYALSIAANLVGLALSCCRTALVSMFVGVLVILLINRKTAAFYAVLACELCLALLLKQFGDFFERLSLFDIGMSLSTRLLIWKNSLIGILRYPLFGRGPLSYPLISEELGSYSAPHAHNLFLESLLSYGVCGTALLGRYFYANIKDILSLRRSEESRGFFSLAVAAACAVGLHGLTDVTVLWPQTSLVMLLLFAGV